MDYTNINQTTWTHDPVKTFKPFNNSVKLSVCHGCGALVVDQDIHDEFHNTLDKAAGLSDILNEMGRENG